MEDKTHVTVSKAPELMREVLANSSGRTVALSEAAVTAADTPCEPTCATGRSVIDSSKAIEGSCCHLVVDRRVPCQPKSSAGNFREA